MQIDTIELLEEIIEELENRLEIFADDGMADCPDAEDTGWALRVLTEIATSEIVTQGYIEFPITPGLHSAAENMAAAALENILDLRKPRAEQS